MIDKPKILIVDDKPENLFALENVLSNVDANLIKATNGNDALKETLNHKFGLAILDVHMPEMDGYELAELMRHEKNTDHIPIIFLSAVYSDEFHVFKGYKSGAVDFLTKPYNPEIFIDKVKVFIELDKRERELEEHKNHLEALVQERTAELRATNERLESLAEERAKQLIHSDRMATLGVMATGIEHEINNPLGFISGNVQVLQMAWGKVEKTLRKNLEKDAESKKDLKFILKEMPGIIDGVRYGVSRISHVVKGFRAFARKDLEERHSCSVNKCIEQALDLCKTILKPHISVEKQLDKSLPKIEANLQQLEQVFINLFANATDAMESQEKGILRITTSQKINLLCVVIEDTGPGIPEDKIEKVWDPFHKTENVGMAISHRIIEDHRGTIRVENKQDRGARFIIELPC